MEKYICKATLVAELEDWRDKIKKGIFSIPLTGSDRAYATFEYEILGKVRDYLDIFEIKEVDLEKEIDSWVNDLHTAPTFEELDKFARHFFELGLNAKVVDANLWKSADGDELPELEREVVVFTQKEGLSPRVGIAHRPDPKGWDGTSISTGKTEHFEPMLYGKGGWSLPDVKIWLDCKLPFKEDEV